MQTCPVVSSGYLWILVDTIYRHEQIVSQIGWSNVYVNLAGKLEPRVGEQFKAESCQKNTLKENN